MLTFFKAYTWDPYQLPSLLLLTTIIFLYLFFDSGDLAVKTKINVFVPDKFEPEAPNNIVKSVNFSATI